MEAALAFSFTSLGDQRGILYWLGTRGQTALWQNPADDTIHGPAPVTVSASSCVKGSLRNVTEWSFTDGHDYRSDDQMHSWVEIQFRDCEVCPSVYSMAHRDMMVLTQLHLRSWQLQGFSGKSWVDLDTRVNDRAMCEEKPWVAYATPKCEKYYRRIRLLMKPLGNASHSNVLAINCLELYGKLRHAAPAPQFQPPSQPFGRPSDILMVQYDTSTHPAPAPTPFALSPLQAVPMQSSQHQQQAKRSCWAEVEAEADVPSGWMPARGDRNAVTSARRPGFTPAATRMLQGGIGPGGDAISDPWRRARAPKQDRVPPATGGKGKGKGGWQPRSQQSQPKPTYASLPASKPKVSTPEPKPKASPATRASSPPPLSHTSESAGAAPATPKKKNKKKKKKKKKEAQPDEDDGRSSPPPLASPAPVTADPDEPFCIPPAAESAVGVKDVPKGHGRAGRGRGGRGSGILFPDEQGQIGWSTFLKSCGPPIYAGEGRGRGRGRPDAAVAPTQAWRQKDDVNALARRDANLPPKKLPSSECPTRSGTTSFPWKSAGDHGVIYYLACDRGTAAWSNPLGKSVDVRASSIKRGHRRDVVDHTFRHQVFYTGDLPGSWIEVALLHGVCVKPSCFTFSHRAGMKDFFPRSFTLAARRGDGEFHTLAEYRDDRTFSAKNLTGVFDVTATGYYDTFRITLEKQGNSRSTSALVVTCFEVYGDLKA